MTERKTAAVILAAGMGTRMKSALPKVMHPLAGRPMIRHILDAVESAGVTRIVVVVGPGMESVADAVKPHGTVVQTDRLGTAHATLQARNAIGDGFDDVLILNGDNPLIPAERIGALVAARGDAAVAVLGFRTPTPGAYGRMIVDAAGNLSRIVEAKDANTEELAVDLCSSGMMSLDGRCAFAMLARIGNANAKGEYYLPDVVGIAGADGRKAVAVEGVENELIGINTKAELAVAEAHVQAALRARAMAGGTTMTAPETVFMSWDTKLGADTVVGPFCVFGPGVSVGDGVEIRAFSHLEGAVVEAGAVVGPYARLRPGAHLGRDVHIGNFVEVKNATLGTGAKANHLSYVGDSDVGAGANIGAGTITCNYDGVFKWRTVIGDGAFIGSNTALVAPVTVGAGAVTGAGSVIAKDVSADALAVTRAPQKEVAGWGKSTRERKKALKAKGEKG